ncbi:MAG TPA: RES family NAD+ phosphorylase [Terracidiphilus sp.]|jgi:RES domain-containing protein
MKIWRICRAPYAAEAFSGEGARRFGGRWNSRGVPMVYCSSSLALAAIELFVHLEPNLQPSDLVSIAAELPAGEPAQRLEQATLPPQWWSDDFEPLRERGDRWIREKSSLAMFVPSAPLHAEWNVLLNPLHPDARKLKVEPAAPFIFDARMFRETGK